MPKPLPSQEYLRECFDYNPDTGVLSWKSRKRAGSLKGGRYPHWRVGLAGEQYQVSRVVWKLVHNEEPPEVDHINRDSTDNRLANLRASDRTLNGNNRSMSKDNTTGFKGVSKAKAEKKYMATARLHGEKVYIGKFSSAQSAAYAYDIWCLVNKPEATLNVELGGL